MNSIGRTAVFYSLRTFVQVRRQTYQSGGNETAALSLDSKTLLSEENRLRCLKKMNTFMPNNIKLKGNGSDKSLAAVLIAICTDSNDENPSLLYTRRSRTLRSHMSQNSFPGGIKDNGEDFIQCALREAEEEVGLSRNRVEIWGTGGLFTHPRTASIVPIIGVVKNFKETELQINPSEVEEAFNVPISFVAKPNSLRYTQFISGYSAPVFVVGNRKIWGVTGYLTNIFLNSFLPPRINDLRGRVKYIKPFRNP